MLRTVTPRKWRKYRKSCICRRAASQTVNPEVVGSSPVESPPFHREDTKGAPRPFRFETLCTRFPHRFQSPANVVLVHVPVSAIDPGSFVAGNRHGHRLRDAALVFGFSPADRQSAHTDAAPPFPPCVSRSPRCRSRAPASCIRASRQHRSRRLWLSWQSLWVRPRPRGVVARDSGTGRA